MTPNGDVMPEDDRADFTRLRDDAALSHAAEEAKQRLDQSEQARVDHADDPDFIDPFDPHPGALPNTTPNSTHWYTPPFRQKRPEQRYNNSS
jgi:hypothetical protein